MTESESLILRLQSLTGPSREIDAEIALAFGWRLGQGPGNGHAWWSPDGHVQPGPPRFTASIDAALTLMPEGLGVSIGRPLPKYCGGWYAELFAEGWGSDPDLLWTDRATPRGQPRNKDDYRATPAIALLIAIMKAREAGEKEKESQP